MTPGRSRPAPPVAVPGPAVRRLSADPGSSLDEMEPLREIVGDARVVALGEGAHLVREFTELRARSTRFLVERMGFTHVACEVDAVVGIDLDPWFRGEGAEDDLVAIAPDATRWCGGLLRVLREHNRRAPRPAGFVGVDVPRAGGSLLPALVPLRDHLREADPGLVHGLDVAIELAERFASPSAPAAIPAWRAMAAAEQDALTAALARLRALMRARRPEHGTGEDPDAGRRLERAMFHLDTAIATDYLFGATHGLPEAGEQMAAAVSLRDRFMADTVRGLLDRADPAVRIVLLAHNTHVQKTPLCFVPDAPTVMHPLGQYLTGELADDYVAIASTHTARSIPELRPDGVTVTSTTLDPPPPTSFEAAIEAAGHRDPTLVALRGDDGLAGLDRIRAQGGWSHTSLVDAFDAVLTVPTVTLEPVPARHVRRDDP